MSFTFRPATREDTPLVIGLAGPTKSGKTMSALILAAGLTDQRDKIAMLNTEGGRGEQYADWYEARYGKKYLNCNFESPFSPERYTEGLRAMKALRPAVAIVDSATHMHDGPGGLLEYHDAEVVRLAGDDERKQQRVSNGSAWIRPKAAENQAVYAMLELQCPVILCFRAKEKQKLVTGKPPIDLGWQPIAGDRIAFETIFTLVLPPHSKGIPDLSLSEMRSPFDAMIPKDKPIDEALGKRLAEWARGGTAKTPTKTDGITREQAGSFAMKFDAALPEKCKPNGKTLLDAWMKKQGLSGLGAIAPSDFDLTLESAVQYAKECVG